MTLPESADRPTPGHAQPFRDPDPFQELRYPNAIAAKKAVARTLGIPLARLPEDRIAALEALLSETLDKPAIEDFVRDLTVRYLPHASHWVQQEAPAATNAALDAFLDASFEGGRHERRVGKIMAVEAAMKVYAG